MKKALKLAAKLQQMAQRGEGGEKHNAADILENIIKKYNLDIDELEENNIKLRNFRHEPETEMLLVYIIMNVIGDTPVYIAKDDKNVKCVDCTLEQYIEITEKLEFYTPFYKDELKIFDAAFVMQNGLTFNPANGKSHNKFAKFDERITQKATYMALGIDKNTFRKQLKA